MSKLLFTCDRCEKLFPSEYDLTRHLSRKIQCNSRICSETGKYMCPHCEKLFSGSSSLSRHIRKSCKAIKEKEGDTNINNGNNNINGNNNATLNHSHNTTNSHNTKNVHITINRFGDEDLTHITDAVVKRLIKKGFDAFPELMQLIHYNVDKPANHNILIDTKYDKKTFEIYDGRRWKRSNGERIVDALVLRIHSLVREEMEQLEENDRGYAAAQNILQVMDDGHYNVFGDRLIEAGLSGKHFPKAMKQRIIQQQIEQAYLNL